MVPGHCTAANALGRLLGLHARSHGSKTSILWSTADQLFRRIAEPGYLLCARCICRELQQPPVVCRNPSMQTRHDSP